MSSSATSTPYTQSARYFKALAHPVRLQIVDILRAGEACVCHLESALGLRQTYISQQLMILRRAGIVQSRKVGLQVYYRLTDDITEDVLYLALGSSHERIPLAVCPCPQCDTK